MLCPRCKLTLHPVQYEGVDVDMCDGCWGFWLERGELEELLEKPDLTFSPEERARILDVRGASKTGPTAPAPCPACRKTMQRLHYDSMVHLVIDRCPDHGVWLDTGEIKRVQALAGNSREYHRLFLQKLGLIPQT